jgi:hypothetical protein
MGPAFLLLLYFSNGVLYFFLGGPTPWSSPSTSWVAGIIGVDDLPQHIDSLLLTQHNNCSLEQVLI